MRRTKAEAALTRQSILRSSLAVFSTKGYAAARLDDVARMAGVTRGAVYWHFHGKPGLYQALLETYAARAGQIHQEAIRDGGTFAAIVHRWLVRLLTTVEEDRGLQATLELGLFKTEDDPELRAMRRRQLETADEILRTLADVIRQAAARGEIRPDVSPDAAARALIGLQNGVLQQWLLNPRSFSLRDLAPALADVFLTVSSPGRGTRSSSVESRKGQYCSATLRRKSSSDAWSKTTAARRTSAASLSSRQVDSFKSRSTLPLFKMKRTWVTGSTSTRSPPLGV